MEIKVSDAICEKRKKSSEGRWFYIIKFRPNVSAMACWTLYKLERDLRQHPPYNSDMEPLDCYLFSHLRCIFMALSSIQMTRS
ncbi:uncharacterized protein TNCV_3137671 [Trichonephila clavipes]|nr:uncharacterized protein TNCV_3137671 [Trichonephila clavipes]